MASGESSSPEPFDGVAMDADENGFVHLLIGTNQLLDNENRLGYVKRRPDGTWYRPTDQIESSARDACMSRFPAIVGESEDAVFMVMQRTYEDDNGTRFSHAVFVQRDLSMPVAITPLGDFISNEGSGCAIDEGRYGYRPALARFPGHVHTLWIDRGYSTFVTKVLYRDLPDGQPATLLTDVPAADVAIAVNTSGQPYAVVAVNEAPARFGPISGDSFSGEDLPVSRADHAALLVDGSGTPHVLLSGAGSVTYLVRSGGGTWTAEQLPQGYKDGAIALMPDGTPCVAYVAFTSSGETLFHGCRFGGQWQLGALTDSTETSELLNLNLDVTSNGTRHLAWGDVFAIHYARLPPP